MGWESGMCYCFQFRFRSSSHVRRDFSDLEMWHLWWCIMHGWLMLTGPESWPLGVWTLSPGWCWWFILILFKFEKWRIYLEQWTGAWMAFICSRRSSRITMVTEKNISFSIQPFHFQLSSNHLSEFWLSEVEDKQALLFTILFLGVWRSFLGFLGKEKRLLRWEDLDHPKLWLFTSRTWEIDAFLL